MANTNHDDGGYRGKAYTVRAADPAEHIENRYLVLKRKDVNAALNTFEMHQLQALMLKVAHARIARGADPAMKCVVVEADWPQYNAVMSWLGVQP